MDPYLFFSYNEKDSTFADRLYFDLTQRGIGLWKYGYRNTVGDDFVNKINQALQNSSGLIALLSENYMKSQYCPIEFNTALDLKIPIFPVVLDNFSESLLPFHWQRMVFIRFSGDKYSVSLSRLTSGIREKTAFTRVPTCLIVIKRESGFFGGANPFTIYFDDKSMGEVKNGKTLEFKVEPGEYNIKASYKIFSPGGYTGEYRIRDTSLEGTTDVLPFSFQSGKRYTFECGYVGGLGNAFKSASPLYLRLTKID